MAGLIAKLDSQTNIQQQTGELLYRLTRLLQYNLAVLGKW